MVAYANMGSALLTPDDEGRTAFIDLGFTPPRAISYRSFDALANAYARGLYKRGLRAGDRVAAIAANSYVYLAVVYGALRAGITVVPVNYKLPASIISFILQDSAIRMAFVDGPRRVQVPDTVACIDLDTADASGLIPDFCDAGPFEAVTPGEADASMILYTSGSSGVPKGVVFSHLGHLWGLDRRTSPSGPSSGRTVVAAPLYHQNGLASSQATLGSGGTVILLPGFEVETFARAIADYGVEMITAVPTMIAMMVRKRDFVAGLDLSRVRQVRVSSAPSTPALFSEIKRLFRNATVVNGFGTTEGGPIFFGSHPEGLPQPEMSVGCGHPDVTLRLMVDGREIRNEGVLQIRSRAVMMGYLNKPELTAKVMTEDGFYNTGDIFRRDENGFFFFVRRADDMFVCGGENVFPGDVEGMLLRHPAIAEACVVPVEDEIKGFKPVAFVVAKEGQTLTEDDVKAFALENGPAYQHPRRVFIVSELPLAGTNKIDRHALADRAGAAVAVRNS
ncbi:class I adenylate-forming enzyme family protein [Rhizobium puerariae]|uniref:Class I adenylate-forming enzyme family protein n=1 Tax=Rhizobium puerariae TaxID=1585791 RepID=A0ABV6AIT6_9HYPH